MPTDPVTTLVSIWAGITTVAAAYERIRSSKKSDKVDADNQALSDAKMWKTRGDDLLKLVDEYKGYFEKERVEHAKTRDYWHDKATSFQADLSKCQEQIIELKGRPDLSDVLKGIKEILDIIKADYEERKHEH